MRLFVALDLPSALADDVAAVQDRFADAAGLRFIDSEQAHVTLKFLGDVDRERLPAVEEAIDAALDDADVGPFDATVGGLGVFPSLDYISVIWTGVREGGSEMRRLHEAVEAELTGLGFDEETHVFTPHVTLARMDDARGKALVTRLVREQSPTVGSFRVSEVRLKRSELGPDGPEYSTVSRFAL